MNELRKIEDNEYTIYALGCIYNNKTKSFIGWEDDGYLRCKFKGKNQRMHRIIYETFCGKIREGYFIDHKNRCRSDNRLENLREATHGQNQANKDITDRNTSGFVGVSKNKKNWQTEISIDGKQIYLGCFNTAEEAARFREDYIITNNLSFYTRNFPEM
jgi:hypothetical protein